MRLLFYTATIALLSLGGAFAYFAMQPPPPDTGPKVVLSIEPYESSLAEAKTTEILQNAPQPRAAITRPDPDGDRLPQEDDGETPDFAESGNVAPSQSAEASEEIAISEPAEEIFSIPGATIGGLDRPIRPAPSAQAPAAAGAPLSPGAPQGVSTLTGTAGTDPAVADIAPTDEPELLTDDYAEETPVETESAPEQNVAALTEPLRELPAAGNAAESPGVQPERGAVTTQDLIPPETKEEAAATPSGDAVASSQPLAEEDVQQLRATFNAFVASKKEQERQETASLIDPPPVPLKRPDNIPAPIRTASLNAGAATPRVAILLRGVGRNDRNSEFAVSSLPPAISMAVAPYVGSAQQWAAQARERGHEVIIQVPLEPSDYPNTDPGPETLLVSSTPTINASRLRTVLDRFSGYSGVTSYFGGKLLQSEAALRPFLEDIKSRGLIYISEPNASQALVRKLAGELGVLYGGADVVVDTYQTPEQIQKGLEELVGVARQKGSAIGLAYASRSSIEQLRIWSETVAEKGVTLVPVGVLAQTPGAS